MAEQDSEIEEGNTNPEEANGLDIPEGIDVDNEIHELSDEEIKQLIEKDIKSDSAEDGDENNDETSNSDPEETPELGQPAAPAKEGTPESPGQPVDYKAAYEAAMNKMSELQKTSKQQESYIQDRNQELGELRKQLIIKATQVNSEIENDEINNPREVVKKELILSQIANQVQAIDQERENLTQMQESRETLETYVKDYDIDLMTESLSRDGISKEHLESFRQNPFGFARGDTLIQIAKRSIAENYLKQILPMVKSLVEENKKLKTGTSSTISKIEKTARKIPAMMSGKSGGATNKVRPALLDSTISDLSDAELERLLKEAED